MDRVDPIGHEEGRPSRRFAEKVAHRPIQRSRQPDSRAIDGDERKRSVDAADGTGIAKQDAVPRLLDVHVADLVEDADRGDQRPG